MSNVVDGTQIEGIIKDISNNSVGVRADFKPELFNNAIKQKGYRMLWEQGMFCSCISLDSGAPDYSCSICNGSGYVYFGGEEIRALVTSINGNKQQEKPGLNEMGSAYLTPTTEYNIGFRDRFTMLDFTTKFSEVLTRGHDSSDKLRYPVQKVIAIRQGETIYKEGIDFNISENKFRIEWLEDTMYAGERYSILYTTCPVYIAIGPIHEIRGTYIKAKAGGMEAFVSLPKQFQIKREDFLDE